MQSPRGEEQLLPGLEPPADDQRPGEVEAAARRTLVALEADDLIEERHAVLCQGLVTLARQYDKAASSPHAKAYGIAQLHAQLLATMQQLLPTQEGGDDDDPWTQLEREIAEQARDTAARDRP